MKYYFFSTDDTAAYGEDPAATYRHVGAEPLEISEYLALEYANKDKLAAFLDAHTDISYKGVRARYSDDYLPFLEGWRLATEEEIASFKVKLAAKEAEEHGWKERRLELARRLLKEAGEID